MSIHFYSMIQIMVGRRDGAYHRGGRVRGILYRGSSLALDKVTGYLQNLEVSATVPSDLWRVCLKLLIGAGG